MFTCEDGATSSVLSYGWSHGRTGDVIEVGAPQDGVSPELLCAAGGFAWWYVDVVTPGGDGVVLIWSYGLPFLPGYAAATRRGAPQLPAERPSVNLVVYRAGAPVFYLLQEHPPERADVPGDLAGEQRLAGCRFTRRTEGGRLVLEAVIDCAVPGMDERLTGTVRVDGVARAAEGDGGAPAHAPHVWTPLTGPATGEVTLDLGGRPLAHLWGRAYHDRNGGHVPLHELAIDRWMWGRIPLARRECIYYLLWPEGASAGAAPLAIGVEIGADGATRRVPLSVELGPSRRALAGLRWPERLVLHDGGQPWMEVRHRVLADDGPFYLRLLSDGVAGDGEQATGWSEIVHPARVDSDLLRPLVRMKVHRVEGRNSVWLPLFTGPREGRVSRLLHGFLFPRALSR